MAAPMNVMAAVRSYVDKIVGDPNCPGMKVLLLDEWTTKTVAMVYSQTEILDRDVYLVERLDQAQNHEVMKHLKACVFVRPTPANFAVLTQEVRRAKFSEYHVFFSNVVPGDALKALAEADENEVVRQVQEYYADFVPVNAELFSLNQRQSLRLSTELRDAFHQDMFARNVNGLLSALLSLKLQPSVIRYAGASRVAKAVAAECASQIAADGIFHFARLESPRFEEDAALPLRSQWTYQAMVHELLGLNSNRVKLKGAPGVKDKDLEEVVLSATDDAFYAENKFANFGDLGMAVKDLLDDYQRQTKMNENISSIEDMQSFMERYPAFRSKSLNVTKHVALIGELSRLVDVYKLMDVSQLEQDVACNDDKSAQWREVLAKLNDAAVKAPDKLRLAMLYALRYESAQASTTDRLKLSLEENRVNPDKVALLDALLAYGGKRARGPGLFDSNKSLLAKFSKQVKSSLEGIENVYAQHVPLLMETLDAVAKGKLNAQHYPAATTATPLQGAKHDQVIVYIVGGVTYEEATKVAELNAANAGVSVVLGGSFVHNSGTFLEDLDDAFGGRR
ncbi:hypothetical protein AURANDRAFT_52028 [Aureococcus anophagefferens]|uniref:Sec1-like protein n=1 Tax=Aureococcus anophagefferens TaxID=44056 RepID=F0XW02_AURAN|nr:hypothetical protein AURANDRAFT_52028 [Aureococcus anophagefferens]EGB13055.1 hypothetical protein AURANDRAFT_52028 [Aureococcus anophagefferens]|eukprot:XP_009032661.1 hypothetical protein AURANDRAFT_52028 [Aureococcus anophagefferens]